MLPLPTPLLTVYPRVGGETADIGQKVDPSTGLSPRGRGNLAVDRIGLRDRRSIPAWAGKPRSLLRMMSRRRVYPRVGGETFTLVRLLHMAKGLSPRGRGNPVHDCMIRDDRRSIPAWAGKPRNPAGLLCAHPVYPRVGGETPWSAWRRHSVRGLSPRGRGNRPRAGAGAAQARSIPAWAGKPSDDAITWYQLEVYPRVGGETE